jgi:twitching motility protein PilU
MEHAISFAQTGRLCIGALHANNAAQALDRIINFYPEDRRSHLLMDLSMNLQCVVSQRLVATVTGTRCAAYEVMLVTPMISDLILRGDLEGIGDVMEKSESIGMKTVESALYELYREGMIDEEEALRNADSEDKVARMIAPGEPAGEAPVASNLDGFSLDEADTEGLRPA